ncbi:unnamed protein product, partial [Rangifer tarandus platyrhynchus]
QEYWSGLPFPSPGDLPYSGIEPGSPALQADALTSEPPSKSLSHVQLFAILCTIQSMEFSRPEYWILITFVMLYITSLVLIHLITASLSSLYVCVCVCVCIYIYIHIYVCVCMH